MSSKYKVRFFFEEPISLRRRRELKNFLEKIFRDQRKPLQALNYVFCSDNTLLEINRKFLHHNYYTDIITFPLSTNPSPIEAEVYISFSRVRENARNFGQTFEKELHRVIFHGALHLCGFKDKRRKEQQIMRRMEDKYLSKYFSRDTVSN
jgi:rRNA maturation RNase YbeY